MNYIGIDIAGLKRHQVIAVLGRGLESEILFEKIKSKNDVIKLAKRLYKNYGRDAIVAIDAPRTLSGGRRNGRECERKVYKAFYPDVRPQWAPTRENLDNKKHEWMKVGFWFFKAFGNNANVIEVIPSASYKALRNSDVGVRIPIRCINKRYRKDIMDAITAAITGYYYRKKKFNRYGDKKEGFIVVPRVKLK